MGNMAWKVCKILAQVEFYRAVRPSFLLPCQVTKRGRFRLTCVSPSPRCQNTTLQLLTLRGRREEGRRKGGFSGRSQFFFQAEAPKKVNSAAHAFISPIFFGHSSSILPAFFPRGKNNVPSSAPRFPSQFQVFFLPLYVHGINDLGCGENSGEIVLVLREKGGKQPKSIFWILLFFFFLFLSPHNSKRKVCKIRHFWSVLRCKKLPKKYLLIYTVFWGENKYFLVDLANLIPTLSHLKGVFCWKYKNPLFFFFFLLLQTLVPPHIRLFDWRI